MTSTRRPLIGLTGRRKTAGQIIGTPESLHGLEGDWFYADYARGVLEAGGLPVHLSLDVDPAMYAGRLDGIVLSGGADVEPSRYGAEPDAHADLPETIRDDFELALLGEAIETELPVLGICRGLQILNVLAGGTLHQDVPEHARYDVSPSTTTHAVDITEGSDLERLYGRTHTVNSLHHQTIDKVGDDLVVTASHDGTVEGLEHASLPILAVQWHPEMMTTRDSDPVFRWIVEQAMAQG